MIYMYVGGLPPIPTSSFWQFSSLAVFPSFWVLDFRGRFEALKTFLGITTIRLYMELDSNKKMCIPLIDLSNGLLCA
jgi:hypothetical protein